MRRRVALLSIAMLFAIEGKSANAIPPLARGLAGCIYKNAQKILLGSRRDRSDSGSFTNLVLSGKYEKASKLIDKELPKIRREMKSLDPDTWQTILSNWSAKYTDDKNVTSIDLLVQISNEIGFKSGETLIDIGSGQGHPNFVFGALNPGLRSIGYDLVKPKVDGANRLAKKFGLANVSFVQQDLSSPGFELPEADFYYFYNPVNLSVAIQMRQQILQQGRHRGPGKPPIKVIIRLGGWTEKVFRENESGFKLIQNPVLQKIGVELFEME